MTWFGIEALLLPRPHCVMIVQPDGVVPLLGPGVGSPTDCQPISAKNAAVKPPSPPPTSVCTKRVYGAQAGPIQIHGTQ